MNTRKETVDNTINGRDPASTDIAYPSAVPASLHDTQTDRSDAVPTGYKWTEVGVIPKDWMSRKLGSCLRNTPDYGINAAAVPYDDRLPTYLRISDISDDCQFRPSPRVSVRNPSMQKFFLSEGDLVFARTGASVGKSYRYDSKDGPLVFAGFLIRVSADPKMLEPAFLAYCVQTRRYWEWVATMSIRSGQPGINGQEYFTFRIPLPHLSEQRAIAEALADVDGLLVALEALIAKKRAVKQATMQQLLTGKIRLPGFVGAWETKRIGDMFSIRVGASKRQHIVDGGSYLIVDMGSVAADGRLIAYKRTDYDEDFLEKGELVMPKDDIGGGKIIGKVAYIDAEDLYVLGDHVYSLRLKSGYPRFYSYLINRHDTNSSLRSKVGGSAQLGLARKAVADQEVPVPTVDEQAYIAAVLYDIDTEITALERRREKTLAVKLGMMQLLLTGRVRLVRSHSTNEAKKC